MVRIVFALGWTTIEVNIEVGRGFALFYNLIDKYCKLLWRQKGTDVTDLQRSPIFTLLFTALPVLAPLLQFESRLF